MAGGWRERAAAEEYARLDKLERLDKPDPATAELVLARFIGLTDLSGLDYLARLFGLTRLEYLSYIAYLRLSSGGSRQAKLVKWEKGVKWEEVASEVLQGIRAGRDNLEKMMKMRTLGEKLYSGKKGK